MQLRRRLIPLFVVLAALLSATASAKSLLEQRTRPTVEDVEKHYPFSQYPQNPFGENSFLFDYDLRAVARYIAELEWAYPGAIYMPLGRDLVLAGDVIDAFYRAHGQPGRVKRLNASGPSLAVSKESIMAFIESSGVDFSDPDSPMHVIVDRSAYCLPACSQSTKILNAIIKVYAKRGGDPADLADKIAFFNDGRTAASGVVPGRNFDREAFLRERRAEFARGEVPSLTFAASKSLYRNSEWHGSFGLLRRMKDGTVRASVPHVNYLGTRIEILFQIRAAMEKVSTPEFLKMVQKEARDLGYEFPIQEPADCGRKLRTRNKN